MNAKYFQFIFYVLRLGFPKLANLSARWPLAQAVLESDSWRSPLYQTTNNMMGMMHPAARQTASMGPNAKGFATYRSAWDSIRDILLYAEAFELYNDALYQARVFTKYAADKTYGTKLTAIAASQASQLVSPAGFAAKTVGAVALGAVAVSVAKKALS